LYRQVNLVSDLEGVAWYADPNLVNPWGLAITKNGRVWISDNGTGLSTVYALSGTVASLVVTVAPPGGSTNPAAPSGLVANETGAFVVAKGTNSAPSLFIWSTEDGTVSGWNPAVDATASILAIDQSGSGAVYKGLALATDAASNQFIFVTNFHAGKVEKYDANFAFVTSFTDAGLPAGYAPFGIQEFNGQLYVTFALQDAEAHDDVAGPGNGYVDVFDLTGNLLQRLAANGPLNSPWGLAMAPPNFGQFANSLLVGNFGDGRINAYDPITGAYRGQLLDPRGHPIAIGGLWGLVFVDVPGPAAGPRPPQPPPPPPPPPGPKGDLDDVLQSPALYFTAGINHENDGLFGLIRIAQAKVPGPVPPPPPVPAPPPPLPPGPGPVPPPGPGPGPVGP
jgi:uncharacterized protein (TIGR03118 family)